LILQLLLRCASWPWSYVLCFQKLPNPKDSALVTLAHLASRQWKCCSIHSSVTLLIQKPLIGSQVLRLSWKTLEPANNELQ
jgi:hypothetical protein